MFRVHSVKIEPTEEWNKLTWFDDKDSLLYLEIPKDSYFTVSIVVPNLYLD